MNQRRPPDDPQAPDDAQALDDARAVDALDALDAELAATDDVLHGSLAQLFSAPADLETRTRTRASTGLLDRSVLGTGADLLAVGWQTLRLLLTEPEPDEEVTS